MTPCPTLALALLLALLWALFLLLLCMGPTVGPASSPTVTVGTTVGPHHSSLIPQGPWPVALLNVMCGPCPGPYLGPYLGPTSVCGPYWDRNTLALTVYVTVYGNIYFRYVHHNIQAPTRRPL